MMKNSPWTPEEVERLNTQQKSGMVHPYTCPGNRDCCKGQMPVCSRTLIATVDGWVCACGDYKQDWFHG